MISIPSEHVSKQHKLLYKIFKQSSFFQRMTIRDEVSVKELVPDYTDFRQKVDWYIHELHICIEIMGEQHYKPVRFGGISLALARIKMAGIKKRDVAKRYALEQNGYGCIEISFDEELTEELLLNKIAQVSNSSL